MTSFEQEKMLVAPVSRYMTGKGFANLKYELQFYECRIDLYGFSRRRDLTVAVELKLFKWKQALKQALRYQLCADLVYLAVPRETARRVDLHELERHGIGLISVSAHRCRQVLPARLTSYVKPHYRAFYMDLLHFQS